MNIHIYEIIGYLLICNVKEEEIIDLLKNNIQNKLSNIIMNKLFYLDDVVCCVDDGPTSPLGPGGPGGPGGP
jgi:hypothetical protein